MSGFSPDNSVGSLQIRRKFGITAVISLVLVALLVTHSAAAQRLSEAQDAARLGLSLAREGKLPEAQHEFAESHAGGTSSCITPRSVRINPRAARERGKGTGEFSEGN